MPQLKQILIIGSTLALLLTNLVASASAQVFTNQYQCSEVVITPSPASAPPIINQLLPVDPKADRNTRVVVVKYTGYLNSCESGKEPAGFVLHLTYRTAQGQWRESGTWGVVSQCSMEQGIRLCWGLVTVTKVPLDGAVIHKATTSWLYNTDQETMAVER